MVNPYITPLRVLRFIIVGLFIAFVLLQISTEGVLALKPPPGHESRAFIYLPKFNSIQTTSIMDSRNMKTNSMKSSPLPRLMTPDRRVKLASLMRQRYQQFRNNLKQSIDYVSNDITSTNLLSKHQKVFKPIKPIPLPRYSSKPRPITTTSVKLKKSHIFQEQPKTSPFQNSWKQVMKQVRSAEESLSAHRASGIRPLSRPLALRTTKLKVFSPNATSVGRLGTRLRSSAGSFDPSIVVDFSLLRLTKAAPKQSLEPTSTLKSRFLRPSKQNTKDGLKSASILLRSSQNRNPESKVVRRRLQTATSPNQNANIELMKLRPKTFTKKIKFKNETTITQPEEYSLYLKKEEMSMLPYSKTLSEQYSLPETQNKTYTKYLRKSTQLNTKKVNDRPVLSQVDQRSEGVPSTYPQLKFGPHSEGNDPTAGVPPSEVTIPTVDLSELQLSDGVRDSLHRYLTPLVSALKPLRRSVPGLPGLDYPILNVVPYTNFFCSNMPWPGFYADTEARCQAWHACDTDGRQSTFLCPNGTVFNQALMVCDWWYNADCLASPFLYPLNERLFGEIEDRRERMQPRTRITPELLDTIFIS